MPLSKITRNRQVTIPKEIFDSFKLKEGEFVEFTEDGTRIILRPKSVVDRERATAKEKLGQVLETIWERNKDIDPVLVEREVEKAIKEARAQNLGLGKS